MAEKTFLEKVRNYLPGFFTQRIRSVYDPVPGESGDAIASRLIQNTDIQKLFRDVVTVNYDQMSVFTDYESMLEDPIISGALEMYCDDAFQYSRLSKNIVWATSKYDNITKELEEFFNDIKLNEKIWDWGFDIVFKGTKFLKPIYADPDAGGGIISIDDDIPLHEIIPLEMNGELIGYTNVQGTELKDPWDYIIGKLQSIPRRIIRHAQSLRVTYHDVEKKEYKNTFKMGTSMIEPARRMWKQLRLIESTLILARLERSPTQRIFKINVGDNEAKDSIDILNFYKTLVSRQRAIDLDQQQLTSDYNPIGFGEDVFIPIKGDINQIDISSMGGEVDINAIVDIDFFTKKLFAALKVPKEFLGFAEAGVFGGLGESSLTRLDIRYSRSVKKVQTAVINMIKSLCHYHLLSKGFDIEEEEFEVHLERISTAEEEERIEALSKAAGAVESLIAIFNSIGLMKYNRSYLIKYCFEQLVSLPGFSLKDLMTPDPNAPNYGPAEPSFGGALAGLPGGMEPGIGSELGGPETLVPFPGPGEAEPIAASRDLNKSEIEPLKEKDEAWSNFKTDATNEVIIQLKEHLKSGGKLESIGTKEISEIIIKDLLKIIRGESYLPFSINTEDLGLKVGSCVEEVEIIDELEVPEDVKYVLPYSRLQSSRFIPEERDDIVSGVLINKELFITAE
ncbi:MAG TPA: hypothetical protein ENI23_05895, partial [bacterium]|nr:hypothetical protein [bacterium]